MSKTITSPVKRFSGTVTLADPLNYEQLFEWQDAFEQARAYTRTGSDPTKLVIVDWTRYHAALIPGIVPSIESHTITSKGVIQELTVSKFPSTPMTEALKFLEWLAEELAGVVVGDDELPNA